MNNKAKIFNQDVSQVMPLIKDEGATVSFDEQSLIDDMIRVFQTTNRYVLYKHIEQEIDCDKVCLLMNELNVILSYKVLFKDEIETKVLFTKED